MSSGCPYHIKVHHITICFWNGILYYLIGYIMMKYLAEQKTYKQLQIHQVKWIKVVVKKKRNTQKIFSKRIKVEWNQLNSISPIEISSKTFEWSIFSVILGIYFLCFHICKTLFESSKITKFCFWNGKHSVFCLEYILTL